MRATLTSILGLLMLVALPAQSQTVTDRRLMAVDQVVAARQELLNDTTRFARCPLVSAVAAADSQIGRTRRLSAVVEPGTGACSAEDRLPRPYHTRLVFVDSVALSDLIGRVHLTVQRGDLTFREQHELQWLDAVNRWMVSRITVESAEHHSFGRRPPPATSTQQ